MNKVKYPFEVHERKQFVFVNIDIAKQMILEGFNEEVYGRFMINTNFQDPILYGNNSHKISNLRTWLEFKAGCIPLPTFEQYKKFYNIN